jgi:Zn-dependent peptidase ImmA (M78 family)/DNA-binding XRE family transcriptional regulator
MVNGERVRQIRELLGWTQTAFADRLDVEQATIARIEKGDLKPSESLLEAIALQTGFPPAFFQQPSGPDFPMGSLLFRAHATATVRDRTEAYRYGQMIYEMADRIAMHIKPIPLRLPQLLETPHVAARVARSMLGLSPDTPIPGLLSVVEKAGVLVLALPVDLEDRDAFSLWAGIEPARRPVIFASAGRPGDRLRYSISHELGHLVLHPSIKGQISDAEKEADQFAAEFLMPEMAMRRELVTPVTLASVSKLKARWRVAIQALVRRAFELDIITRRQYTYLFEQIGARGWRKNEPIEVPVEKPRALRKMAELVYGLPINVERLAGDLKLSTRFVKGIIEAHADRSEFGRGVVTSSVSSQAAREPRRVLPIRRS